MKIVYLDYSVGAILYVPISRSRGDQSEKEKKGAGDWGGQLGPNKAGLGGLLRLNKD